MNVYRKLYYKIWFFNVFSHFQKRIYSRVDFLSHTAQENRSRVNTHVAVESMESNVWAQSNLKSKHFVFSIKIYANFVLASWTANNIDPIKAVNFCIQSTCWVYIVPSVNAYTSVHSRSVRCVYTEANMYKRFAYAKCWRIRLLTLTIEQ